MKVLKFGGTSMGSVESLKSVAAIIKQNVEDDTEQVVVCSAMSGVTNQLVKIGELLEQSQNDSAFETFSSVQNLHFSAAKDLGVELDFKEAAKPIFYDLENIIKGVGLIHEISDRSRAYLCAFGEKLSTRLLTAFLKKEGVNAYQVDSVNVKTEGNDFLEDDIEWESTEKHLGDELKILLSEDKMPVMTGFFGTNPEGSLALLGRGGSDFSGAIVAKSLKWPTLEIWTDVDGFLSADPRVVSDAQLISEIGFEEVSELCFFGAKVLHPKTIRPVTDADGSVWIKNTFKPEVLGTKISKKVSKNCHSAVAISSKKVAIITMDMFGTQLSEKRFDVLEKIFDILRRFKLAPDAMASSEALVSFCVPEGFCADTTFLEELAEIAPTETHCGREVICVVCPEEVKGRPGVAVELFKAVAEVGVSIEMYSQNASEIAQLIVVKGEDAPKTIRSIHEKLATGVCNI